MSGIRTPAFAGGLPPRPALGGGSRRGVLGAVILVALGVKILVEQL